LISTVEICSVSRKIATFGSAYFLTNDASCYVLRRLIGLMGRNVPGHCE